MHVPRPDLSTGQKQAMLEEPSLFQPAAAETGGSNNQGKRAQTHLSTPYITEETPLRAASTAARTV